MSDSIDLLARQITGTKPGAPQRNAAPPWITRATVGSLNSDGTVNVNIAGSTAATPADVLDGMVLAVNQVVEIAFFGTRALVIGRLSQLTTNLGWQGFTYAGHWNDYDVVNSLTTHGAGQFRVTDDYVELRGLLANPNSVGSTEGICFLPVAPAKVRIGIAEALFGTAGRVPARIDLTATGALTIVNTLTVGTNTPLAAQAVTYLSLDGVKLWLT